MDIYYLVSKIEGYEELAEVLKKYIYYINQEQEIDFSDLEDYLDRNDELDSDEISFILENIKAEVNMNGKI